MPLFEVTLQTLYYNQVCINRFNYQGTGTPAAVSMSFGLASALGFIQGSGTTDFPVGTMAEAIRNTVSDEVDFVQIQVRNIYSPIDFYDTPFNGGTKGNDTGANAVSPAFAYGFRSNRTRLDIGRAYKRFVGVTEGNMIDGGVILPDMLTFMGTVAERLGATYTYDDEGNTLTYSPIVVSKEKYVVPSSGKTAYRYYATEAEQAEHIATGIQWTPYDTIRTQVSRQYGRGS